MDWDSCLGTCLCGTVTHSTVPLRRLNRVGRDHLEPVEKQAWKWLAEEELLRMQVWACAWARRDRDCC